MTDQELEALRARLRDVEARGAATIARYHAIMARHDESAATGEEVALATAVEQLLVAAREIATVSDWDFHDECVFCHAMPDYLPVKHNTSCPITRLRAALEVISQ